MAKLSRLKAAPFTGATEKLSIPLVENPEREIPGEAPSEDYLHLEVAVAAISSFLSLEVEINERMQALEAEYGPLLEDAVPEEEQVEGEEYEDIELPDGTALVRGIITGALADLVRSSDLTDDDGEPIAFSREGLAVLSTSELMRLLTLVAGALSEAPFAKALSTRSATPQRRKQPQRAARRKK